MTMIIEDSKPNLLHQIGMFLTYTADTDNDTIVAQYTVINGLIDQLTANHPEFDSYKVGLEVGQNPDYDYFLDINTLTPQPINRKTHALEGLQERVRKLHKQLTQEL